MQGDKKKYTCPACGVGFNANERKGKKKNLCPHCLVELRFEQTEKAGQVGEHGVKGVKYTPVIVDPNSPEMQQVHASRSVPVAQENKEKGKLVSELGEMPRVYLLDNGKLADNGSGLRLERKYKIIYINQIHAGWIYCPGCANKLFQNQTIQSPPGGFEHSHKCRNNRCKATVGVAFEVRQLRL